MRISNLFYLAIALIPFAAMPVSAAEDSSNAAVVIDNWETSGEVASAADEKISDIPEIKELPATVLPQKNDVREDYVKKAMQDEMSRSMERLRMDNLQKPYFMSYTVEDVNYDFFDAKFGALLTASENRKQRIVKAEARIGNASFDSSLFVSDPYGRYSPSYTYSSQEGNYDTLRFSLWTAGDSAYKGALDAYSKKMAFVQSRNITELFDDLVPAKPVQFSSSGQKPEIDREWAKSLVRGLSSIFRKYPDVKDSRVSIYQSAKDSYFLNSEGTSFKKGSCYGSLNIYAVASTEDGFIVPSSDKIEFCDAKKELPSYSELEKRIDSIAKELSSSIRSSTIKAYIGPVLFEKSAAATFFEDLFVNNVANPREVWRTESQWAGYIYSRSGELDERLGMKVMPPFLSAYDDPGTDRFYGTFLAGSYEIDDEGVPAQRVDLVKRGILQDYYRFRAATRDFNASNGHGRAAAHEFVTGAPGNIFISPDQSSQFVVNSKAMKSRLIDLCKEQELEYGIIVKRFPGFNSTFNAVRVYVDGREEPVHSLQFTGIALRALRDIAYASREQAVYPLDWSPDASIICPDIIVREMEIRKSPQKPPKKPYLPHPYFSQK